MMSRVITSLFAIGIAVSSAGCVTRTITRFEDSQKAPVTAIELVKNTNYVFIRTSVYQFYLCQDKGSQLVCTLSCDGTNDAVCPKAAGGGNSTSTNIR